LSLRHALSKRNFLLGSKRNFSCGCDRWVTGLDSRPSPAYASAAYLEGPMGGLIYIILVGLVAGWATGKIMKGAGYGVLVDILLGIAGAIFGSWVLRLLGIYTSGGLVPSILVAILGAVLLVVIVRALKKA
jgi:uncharacterized membrane protein YeaQ/YmgE (transglycosylase-associated protein family)